MTRPRLTTRTLLIAMVPIALTLAFAGMVGKARTAARESQCHGSAFYLGHGLVSFRSIAGRFPPVVTLGPDGKTPYHSWRTDALRANLGMTFASYDPTKPWDAPANLAAAAEFAGNLACPNTQSGTPRFTNYVAIVDKYGRSSLEVADATWTGLPPFEDRILFVEWPDSTIGPTEPRDLAFEALDALGPGRDPKGLGVVFADGTFRRLPRAELIATLRRTWPQPPR